MLKLKNVSKFYYSKGVIASGFSKVNLELNMGEFVVITGESGSGKSTLLNVLSGLDTYEEGEMYINGKETSHYNEADFEEYRRKYVGNIFQNFNLVNSYTVYQNVELALLLNGEKKDEIKEKVNNIIDKVGLTEYAKTKCSKLSGGQKQRVAIARALAKETPIIVADEPTGNLDTESAADVINLLSEIAKDKLVIIVTHNLEQIEQHATRLIKMHDGKILEDKIVRKPDMEEGEFSREYRDITPLNRIKLGVRNAFNIPMKFLLIFSVFLLITSAVAGTYSSFQMMEYEESVYGWNEFFKDTSDNRIVLNKPDKSKITEADFDKIEALDNVERIAKDDTFVDYTQSIIDEEDWYYFYGGFVAVEDFDGKLVYGRMPEAPNEIILEGDPDNYDIKNNIEDFVGKQFYLEDYDYKGEQIKNEPLTIVGVSHKSNQSVWHYSFYVGEELFEYVSDRAAHNRSQITTSFFENKVVSSEGDPYFYVTSSDRVPKGEAYVSNQFNDLTTYGYCIGEEILINCKDIYRDETITLKIGNTYNKWNYENLFGKEYNQEGDGIIYINSEDYDNLVNGGIYQSSVFVEDVKLLDSTVAELKELGFNTLVIRDSLYSEGEEVREMISLVKTFAIMVLIVALFFISYFIIKIVLKSRNAYYTTIRTLGGSRKISKQLLDIELFVISTLSYGLFMIIIGLIHGGFVPIEALTNMIAYLTPGNYVLMYFITIGLSYMISTRFARNIFQNSVMSTYREEV